MSFVSRAKCDYAQSAVTMDGTVRFYKLQCCTREPAGKGCNMFLWRTLPPFCYGNSNLIDSSDSEAIPGSSAADVMHIPAPEPSAQCNLFQRLGAPLVWRTQPTAPHSSKIVLPTKTMCMLHCMQPTSHTHTHTHTHVHKLLMYTSMGSSWGFGGRMQLIQLLNADGATGHI